MMSGVGVVVVLLAGIATLAFVCWLDHKVMMKRIELGKEDEKP